MQLNRIMIFSLKYAFIPHSYANTRHTVLFCCTPSLGSAHQMSLAPLWLQTQLLKAMRRMRQLNQSKARQKEMHSFDSGFFYVCWVCLDGRRTDPADCSVIWAEMGTRWSKLVNNIYHPSGPGLQLTSNWFIKYRGMKNIAIIAFRGSDNLYEGLTGEADLDHLLQSLTLGPSAGKH